VLARRCPRFASHFRFHPPPGTPAFTRVRRSRDCLRDKRIVFLGDSVMRELFGEWLLWLARGVPSFTATWLSHDWRKMVDEAADPSFSLRRGPLEMWCAFSQSVLHTP
jgi:hypothetical protein